MISFFVFFFIKRNVQLQLRAGFLLLLWWLFSWFPSTRFRTSSTTSTTTTITTTTIGTTITTTTTCKPWTPTWIWEDHSGVEAENSKTFFRTNFLRPLLSRPTCLRLNLKFEKCSKMELTLGTKRSFFDFDAMRKVPESDQLSKSFIFGWKTSRSSFLNVSRKTLAKFSQILLGENNYT